MQQEFSSPSLGSAVNDEEVGDLAMIERANREKTTLY